MPVDSSLPAARLIGRNAIAFVLDMITVARPPDFVDPLIMLAIVQANLAHLMRDPVMQRTYGDYDSAPPDDLRRPVSVNAIAHSLKLPYETVRRRIKRMAQDGECLITDKGVVIPAAALHSPDHLRRMMGSYTVMRDFYWRLRGFGWLGDLPSPSGDMSSVADGGAPMRAMARLFSEYLLRLVEMLTTHIGDVVSGVLWLAILRANTEQMPDDERGGDDPASFVPDERRRPVRVPELAARLRLPQETTRRHCARLLAEGRVARLPNGYIITAEMLAQPHIVQLMRDNVGHLHRMFVGLAQVGVISYWNAERAHEQAYRAQEASASPARF